MQHSAHPPDVPVPLHLHQHLIKSVFFILAVLADLQWYLIVMLVCIFMKASCENLFMCLFEIHLSFVKRLYNFFFFFFFLLMQRVPWWGVTVRRSGIEPRPQWWNSQTRLLGNLWDHTNLLLVYFSFLFKNAPLAYGSSQARGRIGAAAEALPQPRQHQNLNFTTG